jgi:hypothetical protein
VWISIFDSTGGPQWTHCNDSRLDPCGCRYNHSHFVTRGIFCKGTPVLHIAQVILPNNNVRGSILEKLPALPSLTEIYLQSNLLKGSIPQGLSSMKQLANLQLGHCELTGSIPGGFTALTTLSLTGNMLTGPVPALPFRSCAYCALQLQYPKNATNQFDCPLPPVSTH